MVVKDEERLIKGDELPELNTLPSVGETPAKTPSTALNNDILHTVNEKITQIAVSNISETDTNDIIKRREKAVRKNLEVQDKAEEAKAIIAEHQIESAVIQSRTKKTVTETLTKAEKEQAYFERHKDTLAKYRVSNSCSRIKMAVLVFIDNLATCIAFPFLFLFRLATMLVETFSGLTDSVKKLLRSLFIILLILIVIAILYNYGILKVG